jgi:hypothetical protein
MQAAPWITVGGDLPVVHALEFITANDHLNSVSVDFGIAATLVDWTMIPILSEIA